MRHDPGLAASPPLRYKLEMERSGYSPFRLFRCGTDNLLAKRQRAAYGGTAGPEGSPMGLSRAPPCAWSSPPRRTSAKRSSPTPARHRARRRRHHFSREPDEGGGQDEDDQRAATAVDRGVDLRAQPAARPAESVIARFVPAAARILVIQPSPYVLFAPRTILPNNRFGDGQVLMRPHDRIIEPTPTNRPGQQRRPRTGSLAAACPRSRR
jgi:hypothetical protein